VLAACAAGPVQQDVTDHYLLRTAPVAADGLLHMQVREDDRAVSRFSAFSLKAVDHRADTRLRVTTDGQIVALGGVFKAAWARDHQGRDVTDLLASRDGVVYQSTEPGWIEVGFGTTSIEELGLSLAAGIGIPPKEELKKNGAPTPVTLSVKAADGTWTTLGRSQPRYAEGEESVLLDPSLLESGELVLRYQWGGSYRMDVAELQTTLPLEREPRSLSPVALRHSDEGPVLARLGAEPVTLSPGEVLQLDFDPADLGAVEAGVVRDYVLVTTGRYTSPAQDGGPREARPAYALLGNAPNPFNPRTTISFSLPTAQDVTLRVLDVRGQVVRTLVRGPRPSGENQVTWDGRDDSGRPVGSGVYFYRMEAGAFQDGGKMLLVK